MRQTTEPYIDRRKVLVLAEAIYKIFEAHNGNEMNENTLRRLIHLHNYWCDENLLQAALIHLVNVQRLRRESHKLVMVS